MFAVIVVVWIVIAVLVFILIGGLILWMRERKTPTNLGEREADRAAARESLAATQSEGTESAVRREEGGFN
jgi:cytochrome b subunit of formate dehydrogenase